MRTFFSTVSRRPVTTILIVVAITIGFVILTANGFRIEADLDEYMPGNHPAFVFSEEAEKWFGIADGVLIAISHPDGVFRPETLGKIIAIGEALGEIEGIDPEEVVSLATANNITGSDWGLEVTPFFRSVPTTKSGLTALEEAVRANPMIWGRLVSTDGTAALVVAQLSEEGLSRETYAEIKEIERFFEGPERIYVAGRPIVEGALAELGPSDMKRMGPIVLIAISFVLFILLRSIRYTILSMIVVGFSAIWTFGLMALLGIPVYAVSTMIPVMLVAIGVAYSIHIINSATVYRETNPDSTARELADHAITTITRPVVMTALTTIVGFLSLLTSAVLPVRYFGLFTAFGVFSAMLLSLTLIPASFLLFGVPKSSRATKKQGGPDHVAQRIARMIGKRWKPILLSAGVFVLVLGAAIPRVWIDSSFISNFTRDSDIVLTDAFVNDHFAGTSTLNIVLEADSPDTFKQPEILALIDRLQIQLEKSDAVGDTLSVADYLKRMHQVMHADEAAYYVVPDSRDLIAQYLLLYEMSAEPGSLEQSVDYEYRRANITVQLKSDSSRTLSSIVEQADTFSPLFDEYGVTLRYAGSGYRALVFAELILTGQIKSLALSLLIVVALLSIMFRSLKIGLIGSVPILLTAIANFGVMGLLGVPLSISTALISSIAVGIGIDYAIHFIERYKQYMTQFRNRDQASEFTMHHSGRAILYNATVVAIGFAVLLFSVFPPNQQVGGLISLNMVVSFLGTVTVLYLLLYRGRIFATSQSQLITQEEVHHDAQTQE